VAALAAVVAGLCRIRDLPLAPVFLDVAEVVLMVAVLSAIIVVDMKKRASYACCQTSV